MQMSAISAELDGKFSLYFVKNLWTFILRITICTLSQPTDCKYLSSVSEESQISNAANKELNANAQHPSEMPKNDLLISPRMHILRSSSSWFTHLHLSIHRWWWWWSAAPKHKGTGIKYTWVNKEIKLQQAGRKQMLNTQIENKRTTKCWTYDDFFFPFFFVKTREQTKANNWGNRWQ